jgi:hypothetical protein
MSRTATGALAATIAAVLIGVVAPASPAQAAPTPFTVSVVTANGSGCANTTATARVQPDGKTFTVEHFGFFAVSGGDSAVTAFRRNCQFVLNVSRPEGQTYAVAFAHYSGFALLNEGVTGVQAARYYFQGESETASGTHSFTGPRTESWETVDGFTPEELVWAPCDSERYLNVNTEVRVTPQAADAAFNAMVLDPIFTLGLVWKSC